MRRRKTAIFFLILGICLSALAVALNIGWILLNLREVALLVFGVIFFALIITGLILNTIFLVREIRRNEQHDAFLNAVTHELKTPIASIKLYLETLKRHDVDEKKRNEFIDVMLADNARLLGTVEQVLQASQVREKQRLESQMDIDLNAVVEESVYVTNSRYKLDDGTIRLTVPSEPLVVNGVREELQTAIANLIDNAMKYSPDGPKISIKLRKSGKTAEIYIKDNGIGIANAEQKRIFKRFYRVSNAAGQPIKGTGLGLWIVQSIVSKHGGEVSAESKGVGRGSTFIMRLPCK
ncbi:MAG TPA: HAMP domain-containing sensor histidine kinase [Pyrinomonadaceae bacterium]|nr:HAMP domain-containing sensor histidine kinase [Pyrinomonadaceae bacterium]